MSELFGVNVAGLLLELYLLMHSLYASTPVVSSQAVIARTGS